MLETQRPYGIVCFFVISLYNLISDYIRQLLRTHRFMVRKAGIDIQTLNYIFNISIIIGFIIPLLNLITGWFGGFFDADFDVDISSDVSADAGVDTGADADVQSAGLIPFNVMCLCLFLVVFGAAGHMTKQLMTAPLFIALLLLACLVIAALAYWALYSLLIKRLKNSDSTALAYKNLHGKKAEVTLRISSDSSGTISVLDNTGAPISFRAKIDPDLKDNLPETIQTGEFVFITEVNEKEKLCYVSLPYNKFK